MGPPNPHPSPRHFGVMRCPGRATGSPPAQEIGGRGGCGEGVSDLQQGLQALAQSAWMGADRTHGQSSLPGVLRDHSQSRIPRQKAPGTSFQGSASHASFGDLIPNEEAAPFHPWLWGAWAAAAASYCSSFPALPSWEREWERDPPSRSWLGDGEAIGADERGSRLEVHWLVSGDIPRAGQGPVLCCTGLRIVALGLRGLFCRLPGATDPRGDVTSPAAVLQAGKRHVRLGPRRTTRESRRCLYWAASPPGKEEPQ